MRLLTTIAFVFASLMTFAQSTKWIDFEKAWHNYLTNPTHDNSVKVYTLLPDKVMGGDYPDGGQTSRVFSKIEQLDKMIQRGDRDALRVAFKLFTIADGADAEGLQIEIGKLINTDAKLFLQELKIHRKLVVSLGGLVGNLGEDYVDEPELQRKEKEKRIQSLKNIMDKNLIDVRDECLMEIERQVKIK